MRTARFDFKPRPSYLSMERPKPQDPLPDGVAVQIIVHVPAPIEPWLLHMRDLRRVMTQEEIAQATGLSSGAISRYVNRTHNPGVANAAKIKKLWEEMCL